MAAQLEILRTLTGKPLGAPPEARPGVPVPVPAQAPRPAADPDPAPVVDQAAVVTEILARLDSRITARLDDTLARTLEDRVLRRVEDRLLDESSRHSPTFTTGVF